MSWRWGYYSTSPDEPARCFHGNVLQTDKSRAINMAGWVPGYENSSLIAQAAEFQTEIIGNEESLFRQCARLPPSARHIASNSEVKTIVLGVDLDADSYKVISQISHTNYNTAQALSYSDLISSFAEYVDEEYKKEYKP